MLLTTIIGHNGSLPNELYGTMVKWSNNYMKSTPTVIFKKTPFAGKVTIRIDINLSSPFICQGFVLLASFHSNSVCIPTSYQAIICLEEVSTLAWDKNDEVQ